MFLPIYNQTLFLRKYIFSLECARYRSVAFDAISRETLELDQVIKSRHVHVSSLSRLVFFEREDADIPRSLNYSAHRNTFERRCAALRR